MRKASAYLDSIEPEYYAHLRMITLIASRSAGLALATFTFDLHPLIGTDEQSVKVMHHAFRCDRNGRFNGTCDVDLAYMSKHAIGRLHERGYDPTKAGTTGVIAFIGMLGYLTKASETHFMGQLCPHFDDTLVVGSLKHSRKLLEDGRPINGTFYDVRTVLPADEVNNTDMIEQGRIATSVVASYFDDPTIIVSRELADKIPFLSRRPDDYTLRSAVVRH